MSSDGHESEVYRGRLPELEPGEVLRFHGESATRDYECYVWKLRDGYQVAMKNHKDEYEFDEVTDSWSPNARFYDEYEPVEPGDFPEKEPPEN